jgi:uncharacterized protein (TIGR03085 family)
VTRYARQERRELADLLLASGPDLPTLCTGWTTRDLAAHLVVRERRPDASAGQMIPPLAGHGEHVRMQMAARPYEEIIRDLRTPPWWSPVANPLTDELFNGMEFFIHHEDVRRGGDGWVPRDLSPDHEKSLWNTVKFTARLGLRKLHIPVTVRAPEHGEVTIGGDSAPTVIVGAPGELAMFVSGRQRAARVEIEGAADTADRLRTARIGL